MNSAQSVQHRRPPSIWPARIVLVLALAVTAFAWRNERELVRRGEIIRLQEGFSKLNPILGPLLGARFDSLRSAANATLRLQGTTAAVWTNYLQASEWSSRFPGMMEIGYLEPVGQSNGAQSYVVKHVASKFPDSPRKVGSDFTADPIALAGLQKALEAGYGLGSAETILGRTESNTVVRGIISFIPLPLRARRPGTPAENLTNTSGVIYFALDQAAYFRFLQPMLGKVPFEVQMLKLDSPATNGPGRKVFGQNGLSGAWKFQGTIKTTNINTQYSQWIVLGGGLAVSGLLFVLFSAQLRMRREAEWANADLKRRDAEILELNRELEQRIAKRTGELSEANARLEGEIAERRRAEERLQGALAEEQELGRLKSNFISMVSHEIRTPLALILGSSEILTRYFDRIPREKREQHLDTINQAVQRMSALVEDVLLFSRAESARMEFNPQPLDLVAFCGQLTDELLSATHGRCAIQLAVADLGETARGDETLLRHILANLLTNAVKYSPPGATVDFRITRDNGEAIFQIQDRGMGIPEEDRRRLFTPFYRGKNVATIPGTGLGLVIVRHCVERHGGQMDLASREGEGTLATVRLPMFSPSITDFIRRINDEEKSNTP